MAEPARQILTTDPAHVTIHSRRFGDLSVPADRVITFAEGLVGMGAAHRFALLDPSRADSPFRHLVCLDDPELAFVVCDPEEFWPGYRQHVPCPPDAASDVAVLVLVSVPERPVEMTANLLAPLVIEIDRLRGWQRILDGSDYQTQHRVFPSA